MKILLIGKNGQVGWELQRSLALLGEIIALDRHGFNQYTGDMSNPEAITATVLAIKPDVVVNASAYTAVDKAETEQEQAWLINAVAVGQLAHACKQINALLIHYSTDYVFDGSGTQPHTESEQTSPINYYGMSKLEGEHQIIASQCDHIIFRTSWVYAARGNNFIKTILKFAKIKDELTIINDQFGAPTSAALIADVTAHTIRYYIQQENSQMLNGIYHLVASGEVSWFDYATYFIEQAKLLGVDLQVKRILPVETSQYPTPAKRPFNSRLNNQKLQTTFQLTLPHWQHGVRHTLSEIIQA